MIEIRKMQAEDIAPLADIWLESSLKAHSFIADEYWINNHTSMKDHYLPNAEVYVAQKTNLLVGFVALVDNHIAAVFVNSSHQGEGIGSLLLAHVKELRSHLTLNVFQKNIPSVQFYQSKNFVIASEGVDEGTGEKEFSMKWSK